MTNPLRLRRRWQQHAVLVLLVCFLSLAPSPALSNETTAAEQQQQQPKADEDLFDALSTEDVSAATAALTAGANINAYSPRGKQTPLMQSVLHGRLESVRWCLENGADTSIPERDGYTPMHGAGFQGRKDIAALLHERGGVPLRDLHKDGHEPAVRSCWGPEARHTETVAWFIDAGVPLDEIYDKCHDMTKNSGTRAMLEQRKGAATAEEEDEL